MSRRSNGRQRTLNDTSYDEEEEDDDKDSEISYIDGHNNLINIENINMDNLDEYTEKIKSNDYYKQLIGMISIGILMVKINETKTNKKMRHQSLLLINERVINLNIIPFFLTSIHEKHENECLLFLKAIANIDNNGLIITEMIKNNNLIALLFDLIKQSKNTETKSIAISTLTEIARNIEWKKHIISQGLYTYLTQEIEVYLQSQSNDHLSSQILACIGCLDVNIDCLSTFDIILHLLINKRDILQLQQTESYFLFYNLLKCIHATLTKRANICFQYFLALINTNIVHNLFKILQIDYKNIAIKLLNRTLTIIVRLLANNDKIEGNKYKRNKFIDYIVSNGYLSLYNNLLSHLTDSMNAIRRIYCDGLSYICGGLIYNKYGVLHYDHGSLLKLLISKCISDDDNIKMECGKCLSNIILCNEQQIIHLLCNKNVINALKYVMKTSSFKRPLIRCIESFDIILSKTQFPRDRGVYDYIYKVEKVGLVEVFEILQAGVDDNDKVYTYSYELVQKYYNDIYGVSIVNKSIITYLPLVTYRYIRSALSIQNNLIFNSDLIKKYLFKCRNISFPINKINGIVITCILQTVATQIIHKSALAEKESDANTDNNLFNHMHDRNRNDTSFLTISSLRCAIGAHMGSFNCILDKFDYKLTEKQTDNVYKYLMNKCNDYQSFANRNIFGEILNELGIDKESDILFDLVNGNINDGSDEVINMQQFTYFCTKQHIDLDDKYEEIRNLFISKVKEYHDRKIETDQDIRDKIECIEGNIGQFVKNKYSKIEHKNIVKNKYDMNMNLDMDKNNICNTLTEIALFLKIFSYFNYDEILSNIYIINKLFHSVAIPLLDTLFINKIYTLNNGYFNSAIYALKGSIGNLCSLRRDFIIVLNAILLDLMDNVIDKIQLKYTEHTNNNIKDKKEFNLMDNSTIHQILTEIFATGQTNIVRQIDQMLNPCVHNADNNNINASAQSQIDNLQMQIPRHLQNLPFMLPFD